MNDFDFDLEKMKRAINDTNVLLPIFDSQENLNEWLNNKTLWKKRETTVIMPETLQTSEEIHEWLMSLGEENENAREITLYHLNKIIKNNVALDYETLNQCQNSSEIEQYCDEVCKNLK